MDKSIITPAEAKQKLERFCAYQDRCHNEVIFKLRSLGQTARDINEIVVYLIEHKFLDEERFSRSFARGKHRIKHWGKIRIVNELKARNISAHNIKLALLEISDEEYYQTFEAAANRIWEALPDTNLLKKRKKFCDYLLRKGFESHLVYEKVRELEKKQ